MITLENLHKQIASGEDSTRQFKADVRNAESLASEMAAFANCEGGRLFIGVADDGSIPGLTRKDVSATFDNRIEIISPGHLPNNLTVEKILAGNSNIRNPILVSYVAKGLLPYHGLGSGIKRALAGWPEIDFIDDRDGCLFTATVHRKEVEGPTAVIGSEKSSEKIFQLVKDSPELSAREVADRLGLSPRAVEKQIAKLRKEGRIRRVGPAKGGHWQVLE